MLEAAIAVSIGGRAGAGSACSPAQQAPRGSRSSKQRSNRHPRADSWIAPGHASVSL